MKQHYNLVNKTIDYPLTSLPYLYTSYLFFYTYFIRSEFTLHCPNQTVLVNNLNNQPHNQHTKYSLYNFLDFITTTSYYWYILQTFQHLYIPSHLFESMYIIQLQPYLDPSITNPRYWAQPMTSPWPLILQVPPSCTFYHHHYSDYYVSHASPTYWLLWPPWLSNCELSLFYSYFSQST